MAPPARGTFGVYVVMRPATLNRILEGVDGPLARELMRRGERVKQRAQELVGVYQFQDQWDAQHRGRRPGTLRDSIVKRMVHNGRRLAVIVGSEDPIALWHHEGTVAHPITRKSANPRARLRFVSHGVVVFKRTVNHPGTQPNRFLTHALGAARG